MESDNGKALKRGMKGNETYINRMRKNQRVICEEPFIEVGQKAIL